MHLDEERLRRVRREAVQLAASLPEDLDEALLVLTMAREVVVRFMHPTAQDEESSTVITAEFGRRG